MAKIANTFYSASFGSSATHRTQCSGSGRDAVRPHFFWTRMAVKLNNATEENFSLSAEE